MHILITLINNQSQIKLEFYYLLFTFYRHIFVIYNGINFCNFSLFRSSFYHHHSAFFTIANIDKILFKIT